MAKLPKGYTKAPDGSILKVTEIYQKDSSNTVVSIGDGFIKCPDGKVKTFYEPNEPPLYITLTVEYPFPDNFTINFHDNLGIQTPTDFSVDKGDGVFVDYVQLSNVEITPLGANIIIKSTDDIYEIAINDVFDKKFE